MQKGLPGMPITDPDMLAVLGDNIWTSVVIRWLHNNMGHLSKPVFQNSIAVLRSADFQSWYARGTRFKVSKKNLVPHEVGQELERYIGNRHEQDEEHYKIFLEIYNNFTELFKDVELEEFCIAHLQALRDKYENSESEWEYIKLETPNPSFPQATWKATNHHTEGFGNTKQLARINALFLLYLE